MTVWGQSSGGTSVLALLASPASRGLFHRVMSLSGSPNITADLASAERQNEPFIRSAGCGDAANSTACLLALTTDEVCWRPARASAVRVMSLNPRRCCLVHRRCSTHSQMMCGVAWHSMARAVFRQPRAASTTLPML